MDIMPKDLLILMVLMIISLEVTSGSVSDYKDYVDHPCIRDCTNTTQMTCEYEFNAEWYYVLSKACGKCPLNITDCYKPHCVPTDGVQRAIMTINRMIPGPAIQVCEGDLILVNVHNKMEGSEGTTIHWHGVHQKKSQWMDGVNMLTQCPITSHSTFQYRFLADTPGTHFWHSHSGLQRSQGLYGNLVIRRKRDPQSFLYDYDLPEHVVVINDWLLESTILKFVAHHHDDGDNKPKSVLINGRGMYQAFTDANNKTVYTPLSVFEVMSGKKYRFRFASNGILNCPLQVSVDDHNLLVIASDGSPFAPIEVKSVIIYAGERYDFVINANKTVGNYWIRVGGLADCSVKEAKQVAILRYKGAAEENPKQPITYKSMFPDGKTLNPFNTKESETEIPIVKLDSLEPDDVVLKEKPDVKLYMGFDFFKVDNTYFNNPNYYPLSAIPRGKHLYTPQVNNITLKLPPSPPLTQIDDIPKELICNYTHNRCRSGEFCECITIIEVKMMDVVEIVLIDEGVTFDASHPFHLHGYLFRVVGLKKLGKSTNIETVKQLDAEGKIPRKLSRAPLKDSVIVPDGGYTIIRFRADNPGYWLFHCHIEFHAEIGMALIIKAGFDKEMPKVPSNFPKCGNWKYCEKCEKENTCENKSTGIASTISTLIQNLVWYSAYFLDFLKDNLF